MSDGPETDPTDDDASDGAPSFPNLSKGVGSKKRASVVDECENESIDCPPAHPVNTEDPVIGGFMEETKLKALASAFMENAPDNQLKSAAQLVQERSAFLALPAMIG